MPPPAKQASGAAAASSGRESTFFALCTGASFDKKRFARDIQHFAPAPNKNQGGSARGGAPSTTAAATVPAVAAASQLSFDGGVAGRALALRGNGAEAASACAVPFVPLATASASFFGGGHDGSDGSDSGDEANGDDKKKADSEAAAGKKPVKAMSRIKIRNLYKKKHIDVAGSDVAQPFEHFSELVRPPHNVSQLIVDNLFERNHRVPTPVQSIAIPCLLKRRSMLACAPTGSGKTLAFVIPMFALLREPSRDAGLRAVIVSPTKELAVQIQREAFLLMKGARWRFVVHGQTTRNKDIFVTTPARIVQMIQAKQVDLGAVEYVVFDEGDKLWDENTDFLGQMDQVLAACTRKDKVVSLFSATLNPHIERMARSVMVDPIRVVVKGRVASSSDVDQRLVYAGSELGKVVAVRNMIREGVTPPVLIFVQSVERSKELLDEVKAAGLHVGAIHARMSSAERDQAVLDFRLGKTWVLISTELLARGIDFKGVGTVINFDFPTSLESYVHRVGRTGRAGQRGTAVTFFTDEDKERIPQVARMIQRSGGAVEPWMLEMRQPTVKRRRELSRQTPQRMIVSTRKRAMVGQQRIERQLRAAEREGGGPKAKRRRTDDDDDDDEDD